MNENKGTSDARQWFSDFSTEVPTTAENSYWQNPVHQYDDKARYAHEVSYTFLF